MRIFYNPETRQQIIVMDNFACSIYLQSDETPAKKADELIAVHKADPANLSTCQEIILDDAGNLLPAEEGPKESTDDEILRPRNGDDKT